MILKYETLSTYLVGLVLDHNEAISSQYTGCYIRRTVDKIRPASLNFVNPIRTSYNNEEPHAFKETYNSAY